MTTDQQPGVAVTFTPPSGEPRVEHHGTGRHIDVLDAHLHVLDSGGCILAVYAPGRWADSRVLGPGPSLATFGAKLLHDMADFVDRYPDTPVPPRVYSALLREKAAELVT